MTTPWCARSGQRAGIWRGEIRCACGRVARVVNGIVKRHRHPAKKAAA